MLLWLQWKLTVVGKGCQLVNSVVTGNVKNVAWWHFPIFLFFNMSWITSGRIKKKAGKNVYNPTDLEVALPGDLRGIEEKKKVAARE